MISRNEIICKLSKRLTKKRLLHSIGVADTAVELAKRFNGDESKAEIAGLLHDIARDISDDNLLKMAKDFGIFIDNVMKEQPHLLHGPVGALLIPRVFNIDDKEILRSVEIHTTGHKIMNNLEKIIFCADYIEPGRIFLGVDELRVKVYNDIEEGLLACMDNTLRYLLDRKLPIHPNTISGRNEVLSSRRGAIK